MNSIAAFSFILHDRQGADRLARFFHSLAAQNLPTCRLEVCFADTGTNLAVRELIERFCTSDRDFQLNVVPVQGASAANAWNAALEHCSGLLACVAQPGLRLDPAFVTSHLEALRRHPEADVFSADFLQCGEQGTGLVRFHSSPQEQLRQCDALGPLFALTSKARRILRFREASPFPGWELGIHAVQLGLRFHRLRKPLSSTTPDAWRPGGSAEELARLVTRQSGFFHVDQVRWALGVLRRSHWAAPLEPARLPSPPEIRKLMEQRVRCVRLAGHGQRPVEVLPGPLRRLGVLGAVGA
ncbi:MAG: glycosyltransferase [Desulfovibrio sp.]